MKSTGHNDDGVSIDRVRALRRTDKALLCAIPLDHDGDAERELWVRVSQITEDSEVYDVGHEGTLVVTSWFAEREGLS